MKNIPVFLCCENILKDNPWAFLADLSAIKDQIIKDVDRTNQEFEFFQKDEIKNELTDVLILWAGKNSETQYKQGMNEIAALILLVFNEESLQNPYPDASDTELLNSYFQLFC